MRLDERVVNENALSLSYTLAGHAAAPRVHDTFSLSRPLLSRMNTRSRKAKPVASTSMARSTRQRATIETVLKRAARPLSPQEVLDDARTLVSALGLAAVYRNLKLLDGRGVVRSIALPGGSASYEIARDDIIITFSARAARTAASGRRLCPMIRVEDVRFRYSKGADVDRLLVIQGQHRRFESGRPRVRTRVVLFALAAVLAEHVLAAPETASNRDATARGPREPSKRKSRA